MTMHNDDGTLRVPWTEPPGMYDDESPGGVEEVLIAKADAMLIAAMIHWGRGGEDSRPITYPRSRMHDLAEYLERKFEFTVDDVEAWADV